MSSEFDVPLHSADRLYTDVLSENLKEDSKDDDIIPVLFGGALYHFHSITGGYDKENGEHIVSLIHEVQGDGSPPNDPSHTNVEVHTSNKYYRMKAVDITHWDREYPEESYVLTLHISDYRSGPESFRHELLMDIDKREQEFSFDE